MDTAARSLAGDVARRALTRAAGGAFGNGNRVRLLKDASENYPAWLEAIARAQRYVHFENYIIHDDEVGRRFAAALSERARAGVKVRLIYDWWGCVNTASRRFWASLCDAGVEVRRYNRPHLDSPLGWLSRDHRKTVSVDGAVGFVSGLCVGQMWQGDSSRNVEPWRDTGLELRGPAVADIERAFATLWARLGEPIAAGELCVSGEDCAGDVALRVIASEPGTAGLLPVSELTAALAQQRLWITDAYFAGTTRYLRSLCDAARAGVDVRLLLPGASDVPLMKPLSRAGYRGLLEAGVRIFEWDGVMLHAKTAVADSTWSRVGSTNLNPASWFGNCELDVVIDDAAFAELMEQQYLDDLSHSTEVVLDAKRRVSAPRHKVPHHSARATAAGALRVGSALGAGLVRHRVLEPTEGRLLLAAALVFAALATSAALFPRIAAYGLTAMLAWLAGTFAWRGIRSMRRAASPSSQQTLSNVGSRSSVISWLWISIGSVMLMGVLWVRPGHLTPPTLAVLGLGVLDVVAGTLMLRRTSVGRWFLTLTLMGHLALGVWLGYRAQMLADSLSSPPATLMSYEQMVGRTAGYAMLGMVVLFERALAAASVLVCGWTAYALLRSR